jgi:hypothetical protein
MAYIGKQPVIGNFQKCDAIAVVNGQAAYTLQVGGSNVSPQSENHMLVSLNGILQSPTDSFTVSGSTITFASALSTGDVIDFVMILGNVLDLGVPSDNTVSLAKLTATGTKDATTFLRGDNTFAEANSDIVKLASGNLSGAGTISIDGYFSSTYLNYRIIFDSIQTDTDDSDMNIRVNTSGSADTSSNYYYASTRTYLSSGANAVNSEKSAWGNDKWILDDGLEDNTNSAVFDLMIYNPQSTAVTKVMMAKYWNLYSNGAQYNIHNIGMNWNSTTALTGVTIFLNSGNFETSSDNSKNNWTLYGYKN